jgi:hypothetical protein
MVQVVQYLLSKHETPNSNPKLWFNTTETQKYMKHLFLALKQ